MTPPCPRAMRLRRKPFAAMVATCAHRKTRLQHGYFKARGRFFEPRQFRPMDIKCVTEPLGDIYRAFGLTRPKKAEQQEYFSALFGGASSNRHLKKILELSRWTAMGEAEDRSLLEHADFETQKQTGPEEMFYGLVSYCCKNRFVIPSYSVLSQIVSRGYSGSKPSAWPFFSSS